MAQSQTVTQNFEDYFGVWVLPEADLCSRQFCIIYTATQPDFFNEPGDVTLLFYEQHPGGFQLVGGTLQSVTLLPDGGWEAMAFFGMGDDPLVRYRFASAPENIATDYLAYFTGEEEASGLERGTWVATHILATRLLTASLWSDSIGRTWRFTVEGDVDTDGNTSQYYVALQGENGVEVPGCFALFLSSGDVESTYAVSLEDSSLVLYPVEYLDGQAMRLEDGKVVLRSLD